MPRVIENVDREQYLNILSEIREEIHLRKLVPLQIVNPLILNGMSLLDILNTTEEDAILIRNFGISKIQKLKAFQEELENNQQRFINYYDYNLVRIEIPFSFDENEEVGRTIYQCIIDYMEILRKREFMNDRDISIIMKYYGIETEIEDWFQIANDFQMTKERARGIIRNEFGLAQLFNGEEIEKIYVNNTLIGIINKIKAQSLYTSRFPSLISLNRNIDFVILNRIAELISNDIAVIDQEHFILVKEKDVILFREHYRALIQSINKEVMPISSDEVIELTKQELKRKFCLNPEIIVKLLEENHLFERYEYDNDDIKYLIKLPFAGSLICKVKRILYEYGDKMTKEEILDQYNDKCLRNGEEEITLSQLKLKSDLNLKSIGKSGYWQYIENPLEYEQPDNAWVLIDNYIRGKEGKAYFNEIKDYLLVNNLMYPDTTIRAYIFRSSFVSIDDRNLFIHIDFKARYPDIPIKLKHQVNPGNGFIKTAVNVLREALRLEKSLFVTCVSSELALLDLFIGRGVISRLIKEYVNLGVLIQKVQDKKRFISLDEEQIAQYNLDQLGKQSEPEYRKIIRSQSVNYLKENYGVDVTFDDLWSISAEYFPPNISKSNFYMIFNDSNIFEKYGEGRNRYVKLRYELLPQPREYFEEVEIPVEPTPEQVVLAQGRVVEQLDWHIEFNWERLAAKFKRELLGENSLNDEMVTIGLNAFYNALHSDNGLRQGGESLLESIYRLWFTKTDYYDREVCFLKLTIYYEVYLRKLRNYAKNISGLKEVINAIPEANDLRDYKYLARELNINDIDKQKRSFSYYLNSLIYYRNLNSHDLDNKDLDMGFNKQMQNITNFIALYIYTGYLLGERN